MNYCTLKPYIPGRTKTLLGQVWDIADSVERKSECYLGAYEYGRLVEELRREPGCPKGEVPMALDFGKRNRLRVINSGTDDWLEVALKNRGTAGARDYREKRERLRVA